MAKAKIAFFSILVNLFLASGKIVAGLLSRSSSVLAEGFHSLMDIFSSAVSFAGIKLSQKPADQKHPYGHYKIEVLVSIVITVLLLITGAGILFEGYQNFLHPKQIKLQTLSLAIMFFSALINEIMARIKIHYGKKENSVSLLSDGFHSRIDVFTSLLVLGNLFLTQYWFYADSLLAILIGIYIIKESFDLGKTAIDSLLDVSAGTEIEEKIKTLVQKQNVQLVSLKTQKKGSVFTANLEINLPANLSIEQATQISQKLRESLMKEFPNLAYIAIQIQSHDFVTNFYKPPFGAGFDWQRRGKWQAQNPQVQALGPGGYCFCPQCGFKIPHQTGVPCSSLKCPQCHINLVRQPKNAQA